MSAIAANSTTVVIVGWNMYTSKPVALISADGREWSSKVIPAPGFMPHNVTWERGRFVVSGARPSAIHGTFPPDIWTTTDGRRWVHAAHIDGAANAQHNGAAIAMVLSRPTSFVAFGQIYGRETTWVSHDGLTWNLSGLPRGVRGTVALELAGRFVLVGPGGTVWISRTGSRWDRAAIPGFRVVIGDVTAIPGGFVAVGFSTATYSMVVATSKDLRTWTVKPDGEIPPGMFPAALQLSPAGDRLVGVGDAIVIANLKALRP